MSVETHSRAAEVLNLPPNATAAAATHAFLKALPTADFVPSQESVAAVNTLAGLAVPVAADTTPSLSEEVEEFAGRYWSLTPSERLAQWLALSTRRPDDRAAERLLALQPGLDIPVTPVTDQRMEEVLALVRDLYLLPPRQRSLKRNEWLLANAYRHNELIAIAETIQQKQPGIIGLEPTLFSCLSSRFKIRSFAEAARAETLPADTLATTSSRPPTYPSSSHPEYEPSRPPWPARTAKTPPKSGGWQFGWGTAVGIMLLLRVLGALISSDRPHASTDARWNNDQRQVPYPTDPYVPNQTHTLSYDPYMPLSSFSSSEVMAFQQYDEHIAELTKPKYYDEWIKAGRPAAGVLVSKQPNGELHVPTIGDTYPNEQKRN